MRLFFVLPLLSLALVSKLAANAEDNASRVKTAVERSALNQSGTHPFHLKAAIAPSFERDKASGRSGEVEIWWESPTRWRREVRCAEFHQVEVVDGPRVWQKNEGNFFPEWLQEIAVALIDPVPDLAEALQGVRTAEVKTVAGSTYFNWDAVGGPGSSERRENVALSDATGLIFYDGGLNWGGLYKDYKDFHGRMVGRTVTHGSPEVTAKIVVLEDLSPMTADWFDAAAPGGDPHPLRSVVADKAAFAEDLAVPMPPIEWPALANGPLTGRVSTDLIIDREGVVRDTGIVVADNGGVTDVARTAFAHLRFRPQVIDGSPAQVVRRVSLTFAAKRPAGVEDFGAARDRFEHGRAVSFPAAAAKSPYSMKATFHLRGKSGTVEEGRYEDTWQDATHWRREGWFGNGHFVKTQNGETHYMLSEGSDARIVGLVFSLLEPIPAIDTFTESDWRMKHDTMGDVKAVRVMRGGEDASGNLDVNEGNGYWFDEDGRLVRAVTGKLDVRPSNFVAFDGAQVAKTIKVLAANGGVAMTIAFNDLQILASAPDRSLFILRGHEWKRQFTAEVR
jgi:hypothetical protein